MQFCHGFLKGGADCVLVTLMEGRAVSEPATAGSTAGEPSHTAAALIVPAATEAARLVLRKLRRLNGLLSSDSLIALSARQATTPDGFRYIHLFIQIRERFDKYEFANTCCTGFFAAMCAIASFEAVSAHDISLN
jgi:adenine deaminase